MADQSPDQVLDCSCFQDQKVNQFNACVHEVDCADSISLHNNFLVCLFSGQTVVRQWPDSGQTDLFDAIFDKWTQFAFTLYMFVSIPRGDLDGALF